MTRWFTSDHHFLHRNIIDFCDRPWGDIYAMSAGLLERHNQLVGPDEEVYILGDLVWQDAALETVSYMNGKKYLIPGNHDRCHKMHKSWEKYTSSYEDAGLTILPNKVDLTLTNGVDVQLCHFPFTPDQYDLAKRADKFSGVRPDDDGRWLIHGHVHSSWTIKDRQLNVGVDVWDWKPVSEDKIIRLMEAV